MEHRTREGGRGRRKRVERRTGPWKDATSSTRTRQRVHPPVSRYSRGGAGEGGGGRRRLLSRGYTHAHDTTTTTVIIIITTAAGGDPRTSSSHAHHTPPRLLHTQCWLSPCPCSLSVVPELGVTGALPSCATEAGRATPAHGKAV